MQRTPGGEEAGLDGRLKWAVDVDDGDWAELSDPTADKAGSRLPFDFFGYTLGYYVGLSYASAKITATEALERVYASVASRMLVQGRLPVHIQQISCTNRAVAVSLGMLGTLDELALTLGAAESVWLPFAEPSEGEVAGSYEDRVRKAL